MKSSKRQWILFAVALLLLCPVVASAGTSDEDRLWTTVGSAGTLDETSVGKVFFNHGIVQKGDPAVIGMASRQPRALAGGGADVLDSAVIRYNVTAVDGLFGASDIGMQIRFRDEGKSARVVAKLIEVDIATGAEATLLTFDSDTAVVFGSSGYHALEVCAPGVGLDFRFKAYYIEATLTNSLLSESIAGIEVIQLHAAACISSKF